jgi:hypothetical protein
LIKTPIIRNAIVALIKEFRGNMNADLIYPLIKKDASFKADLPLSLEDRVSYPLLHHSQVPTQISQTDLPAGNGEVFFVYLNGDRLYTETGETLYIYSASDLSSPAASYHLGDRCISGIATEDRLYLGGGEKLHVFEVTVSIIQPLNFLRAIPTKSSVLIMQRVGDELLLG